ncbi:MAG: hypothetical protein JST38_16665 [Bacteroidetes bacterium]|nr:hypothetical protein [Bacteroidota bacterium]
MRALPIFLLSLSAAACKPQAALARKPDIQMDASTQVKSQNLPVASASTAEREPPPKPGDVLYMIYQVDGDGAASYPIQNGSVATYWAGHEFALGGKRYFTGFAYNTPQKFDKDTKADAAGSVTLTEATFELKDPGTPKPWMFVGNEYWIGDYGAMGKGPKFDGSREVLEYALAADKILLAIPSIDGEAPNLVQRSYELFSYSPTPPKNVNDTRWKYLGQVLAGDDFTEVCKAHPDQPCAKWAGTLKFDGAAHAMPTIHVVPHGTAIDDDTGKSRNVDGREAAIYVFRDGMYGFK